MALDKSLLSRIHIARQQLAMDDDSYRVKLRDMFGVRSSKELTPRQARQLLADFERLGWKPQPGGRSKGKPRNFNALPTEITKIEAQLADMRLTWSYADAIARRMYGIERCAWLRKPEQLAAIIAALDVEQKKRQLLEQIGEALDELGLDGSKRERFLEQLPSNWQRHLPTLKVMAAELLATDAYRRLSDG
jgi:phage gp16-like protein